MGLIYLDACIVIYFVEEHPLWYPRTSAAIAGAAAGRLAISPLVKCECLVKPLRQHDRGLEKLFQDAFDGFDLLDMPQTVFLGAAKLRAEFGLKTPDALHLACAQHHGCHELWTNDGRLNKASHGMARNIFA